MHRMFKMIKKQSIIIDDARFFIIILYSVLGLFIIEM